MSAPSLPPVRRVAAGVVSATARPIASLATLPAFPVVAQSSHTTASSSAGSSSCRIRVIERLCSGWVLSPS